jgi:alpha-tubulin suppressor-like RCC1 family protein
MNDGSVWCWGDDEVFPRVGPLPTLTEVIHGTPAFPRTIVHNESGYGCGIFDAKVRCWNLSNESTSAASPAPGGNQFLNIWAGVRSACAKSTDGNVWCWGQGEPWLDVGEVLQPLQLEGLKGADEIAITSRQVCARRGHHVTCTARRELESLRSAVSVDGGFPKLEALALARCNDAVCALTKQHDIACWSEAHVAPTLLEGSAGAQSLLQAGSAPCAELSDKSVACWSCDTWATGPVRKADIGGTAHRAFRNGESCTVESARTVRCSGKIIIAGNGLTLEDTRATRVAGITNAKDVYIDDHELCVEQQQGTWICWSRLNEGHVGKTSPTDWPNPQPPHVVREGAGATGLAVNRFGYCFFREGARVQCFHRTPWGELVNPIDLEKVRRIAMGNNHACALYQDDTLGCWGANESGEVTSKAQPAAVDTPSRVLENVLDVAVGLRHTCAATRDDGIICFGDNRFAQLGAGSTTDLVGQQRVQAIPTQANQVVAGFDHSCARTVAGDVYCWGDDSLGQLGTAGAAANGPRRILGLPGPVVGLAAGANWTCARSADGSVTCWGSPYAKGSLQAIASTKGSVELAVGDEHACVRNGAGRVFCWGSNSVGQLAVNLPIHESTVTPPHSCPHIDFALETSTQEAREVVW